MRGILISGFFAYAALSCVIPIIPPHATSLGAPHLISAIAAGIFALSPAIAMTPFGILSEIYGRRLFIIGGMIVSSIAPLLYLFSYNPLLLVISRLIHGMGTAMYVPAINAIVADEADENRRGEAIGWMSTTLMMGFFAGPIVGGFTAEIGTVRDVFLLSFALSILSLTSAVFSVKKAVRVHLEFNFKFPTAILPFYTLMFVGTAMSSAFALFILPFYASEIKITEFQTGTIISSLFFFSSISRVPAGILSDKLGRKAGVFVGIAIGTLGLFTAITVNPIQLFIASSICGVGMGITNTSVFAAASDCKNRGFAIGLANTVLNAGIFTGSTIAGYMANFLNFEEIMFYIATLNAVSIPLLLLQRGKC